jgi:REP element-mobilizing transposase RayT
MCILHKTVEILEKKIFQNIAQKFDSLIKNFFGRHLWTKEYFVAGNGNVTDDIIQEYI